MNPYNTPGIPPLELAKKIQSEEKFTLLDVRELHELQLAKITDDRVLVIPLSRLARELIRALPPELTEKTTPIVVMCHHGVRSAQVTAWLRSQGWTNVLNLDGGIDAYAKTIDKSVGLY